MTQVKSELLESRKASPGDRRIRHGWRCDWVWRRGCRDLGSFSAVSRAPSRRWPTRRGYHPDRSGLPQELRQREAEGSRRRKD